jgi:cysteinyl-tRNA synthetase
MPVYIYNSLARKKEEFIPIESPRVNIYTCGITVYDESHIGHARSLYIFDLIRRYLSCRGYKVRFVRNITDIDDKIINRARDLNLDWRFLVSKYIGRYYEDLKAIGIARADFEPRATENIPDMIKYISGLIDSGYAYQTASGVYFSVRRFRDYGRLSGQGIEEMLSGVRKESDETKADPLDFALWKVSRPGEPSWPSPWGAGRPGWHIECSVMSQKYLKVKTLDIHAGGRDLIFPHHENEIAQAEALSGKQFAKYWVHHGLLTINNQKMAKSLGNFVTIKDFLSRHLDVDILKFFFLTAHYSHPIDYTEAKVDETKQALSRLHILMDKLEKVKSPCGWFCFKGRNPEVGAIKSKFYAAMDDDFNTPEALAAVFELVNLTNKKIDDRRFALSARYALRELLSIFGITLTVKHGVIEITDGEVKQKLAQRERARKESNFELADSIRKSLEAQGVILEDTKEGTTWRRKL